MTFLVDYSFSRPSPASLSAAGVAGALRYLWPNTEGSKGISPAEYNALHGAGIAVGLVYEEDGRELLGGYNAGVSIGTTIQQLLNQFGYPSDFTVYAAVDFDAGGADLNTINDALSGLASVRGAHCSGIYGGIDVIRAVQAAGAVAYFWQTYAWSGGQIADAIHIHQYSNGEYIDGDVDYDTGYTDNYGQDGLNAATPPTPPGPPDQKDEEIDMLYLIQITDDEGRYDGGSSWALTGPSYWQTFSTRDAANTISQKFGMSANVTYDEWERAFQAAISSGFTPRDGQTSDPRS